MHVPRALRCYLGLYGIQGKQLSNPEKNLTIIHMPTPKTTKDIQVFNGMT
jgi:hypothetical protein